MVTINLPSVCAHFLKRIFLTLPGNLNLFSIAESGSSVLQPDKTAALFSYFAKAVVYFFTATAFHNWKAPSLSNLYEVGLTASRQSCAQSSSLSQNPSPQYFCDERQ